MSWKMSGKTQAMSLPYHPQISCQIKIINKCLEGYLHVFIIQTISMDEVTYNGCIMIPITNLLIISLHLRPFMDIQLLVSHTFCKISPSTSNTVTYGEE